MRISDWSSEVRSSDLDDRKISQPRARRAACWRPGPDRILSAIRRPLFRRRQRLPRPAGGKGRRERTATQPRRTEERRVGKELVIYVRSRRLRITKKKKTHTNINIQ